MGFGAFILTAAITLLIWQPDALKTQLLNAIAKEVSRSTSYELSIVRVSGNLFTGFALENVHVLSKADRSELLRAKAIHIGISWWALLRRKILVQRLDWVEPQVHYDIHQNNHSKAHPASSREPFPFTYSIRRLTIEKGKVIIENSDLPSSKELLIHDIGMDARVSYKHLTLNRLEWQIDQGHGSAQGHLAFVPELSGNLDMQDRQVPLERFLIIAGAMPSPPALPYSGDWTIQIASGTTTAQMKGSIAGGAVALDGRYASSGLERAHVTWQKSGLGNLSFSMIKGVGSFHVAVSSADCHMSVDGKTNWPEQSVEGKAVLTHLLWQEVQIKQADAQFSVSPREQHVTLKTDEVQFHRTPNPFDLVSSQSEVIGLAPHWRSRVQLKFRNGSTADMSGSVSQRRQAWELAWQKLAVAFPSAGTWTADSPGKIIRSADGRIELSQISLSNGEQSLRIPEALMTHRTTNVTLEAHHMDPSPWFKLLGPDTSITSASLDASLRVHGEGQQLMVDGFVTGKAKSLDVRSVGLHTKDLDIDMRAANGRVDIKKFAAKTKKGDITITGGAAWPALDYSLHAHDLLLNNATLIKAVGDLDIHLAGTAEYPIFTGHLGIKEAAYVASTKTEKNKPAASSEKPVEESRDSLWRRTAVDMDTHWGRNVWYREGVTNIETQGDLRIQKTKESSNLILTGSIRSVRGTYNYFGRDFNIDSGQIQFAGTPDINPLLNIEASYSGDPTTTIYLDITGSTDKPVLKVRSNPPLAQEDIISVIVFGQPLNELRSRTGSQTNNQQMMQAAGGVLGSYVTQELRQTGIAELNVDMLNLQATPQGSQLNVGRYLTRRLFISYGQAIRGSAEKSVTADYFLTDKWTLQGASDSTQGNYMDFLFRYPLNHGSLTNTPPLPTSPFRSTLDIPNPQQVGYSR